MSASPMRGVHGRSRTRRSGGQNRGFPGEARRRAGGGAMAGGGLARRGGSTRSAGGCSRARHGRRARTLAGYVLAHEFAHLIHDDHGREFWGALGRVMPDYEVRRARLGELGPALLW
ncbi:MULTISPECIES: M48 metallopeptidase family protein [Sorangium]|uniref:M48 metallopeptidase family protein n=1 Tax=Sorangium TaxID=39643 RepID=UPI003D9C05BC